MTVRVILTTRCSALIHDLVARGRSHRKIADLTGPEPGCRRPGSCVVKSPPSRPTNPNQPRGGVEMNMAKTSITPAEQARRAEAVRQVRHSTEMEGGHSDVTTRADEDAYARGEIDIDELVARVKARAGA